MALGLYFLYNLFLYNLSYLTPPTLPFPFSKFLLPSFTLWPSEHHNFVQLPYDGTLKINLIVARSRVRVHYKPKSSGKAQLIIDRGELVVPVDPSLDKRLSLDGSMCILERVRFSDSGLFRVTDLQGFLISNTELEVEGEREA